MKGEDDLSSGSSFLQEGVCLDYFIECEHSGIEGADVGFTYQGKQIVYDLLRREVAEKAREEGAVGDVLDGVEISYRVHIDRKSTR